MGDEPSTSKNADNTQTMLKYFSKFCKPNKAHGKPRLLSRQQELFMVLS